VQAKGALLKEALLNMTQTLEIPSGHHFVVDFARLQHLHLW
jgi:hypothetical protein